MLTLFFQSFFFINLMGRNENFHIRNLLPFVPPLSPCIVRFAITGHTPCYHKSKLPAHMHTHCAVCLRGMFVLHTDIFGYQSLLVCVCVRVQFLPLNSPSCVASRGCPIGTFSLSLIICLIDVRAKRHKEALISEKKKKNQNLIAAPVAALFSHQKANVGDSASACDRLDV